MAKGMVTEIGGSGDTLNRVEEYLNERRDKAAGRARVASGIIDMSQIEMKEAEKGALAEQALAEFEAVFGLGSPSKPKNDTIRPLESSVKELGPQCIHRRCNGII